MKKLLSILTISGTAIPTAIAASPYQKEEKLNNKINYLQINNLKNLNRNKRENNNKNIDGITESVIKTKSNIYSSGVVLNDKVYFGSYDGMVYEYDPYTRKSKVVITTSKYIISSGCVLNNKLYFGSSDGKLYEYDPQTGQSKAVISLNISIESSGVVLNDKLYFGDYMGRVHEYDPQTGQSKAVIITNNKPILTSGIVLNNKVYFGSDDHNVYEYDHRSGNWKVVIETNGIIKSSGIVLNDKVYFGSYDHKVYEYNPVTGQSKAVITTNGYIESSGVVLNDKLYFGSLDDNLYEYNPLTEQSKIVVHTGESIYSSGVVLNDKLYFGSDDHNVYEYEQLELIESDIINIRDQIKKELYLYYNNDVNNSSEIKPISNIGLDKLFVFNNLFIEEKQKNKASNLQQNIENFCPNFNSTFINNSSIEQTQNTASCSKDLKEIKTFQKTNGFSKSETTSNDKNWNANLNSSVVAKPSIKAGIPFVVEGKVEVEVGGGYTWGSSQSYAIEDNSSSSDTEIKTTENNINITIPSQPVKVPAKSKISIYAISWKNNIEFILSYYQKVDGVVSADFIDKNNKKITISISIKDVMLNLSKNNIIPSKIKINNDDSINFSYDIKSEKEIIMHQTEIGEAIPLSLDEQNITFKNNKMGIVVIKN